MEWRFINVCLTSFKAQNRQSLAPPVVKQKMTWEEYSSSNPGKCPHLGRNPVQKESHKTFKATIAMVKVFIAEFINL